MIDNVTVFDFETTGFDPVNDRVVEIAAIKRKNGELKKYEALIKIDRKLPPKITELTRITDEMLQEKGIDEKQAFQELIDLIDDSIIVAHNAAFDMQFLHHAMMRLFGRTFNNDFIDTVTISRERFPYPHKLENMLERFGVTLIGAHRAINDVETTLFLLDKLHEQEPIDEFINKIGYLKKYGMASWYPEHAYVFGTYNRYA